MSRVIFPGLDLDALAVKAVDLGLVVYFNLEELFVFGVLRLLPAGWLHVVVEGPVNQVVSYHKCKVR
jgi:hypothetical protein